MGYSTKHVPIENYITRKIKLVNAWTQGIDGHKDIETRSVLNILKQVSGRQRFNISELSLEKTDHSTPRYILTGPMGFIEFTLE